jgi:hypothetical protein
LFVATIGVSKIESYKFQGGVIMSNQQEERGAYSQYREAFTREACKFLGVEEKTFGEIRDTVVDTAVEVARKANSSRGKGDLGDFADGALSYFVCSLVTKDSTVKAVDKAKARATMALNKVAIGEKAATFLDQGVARKDKKETILGVTAAVENAFGGNEQARDEYSDRVIDRLTTLLEKKKSQGSW